MLRRWSRPISPVRDRVVVKPLPPAPLLVVVSGPSGSGKGEALRVFAAEGFQRVVTTTTRSPRPGEEEGVDYHFVNDEEFRRRYAEDEFLEYNRTYQQYVYASPAEVLEAGPSTPDQVMELDPEGYFYVRANARRRVVGVFTLPPSIPELDRRIAARARGEEDHADRRLAVARKQIIHAWQYDIVITNTDLGRFREDVRAAARTLRAHQAALSDLGSLVATIRNDEAGAP